MWQVQGLNNPTPCICYYLSQSIKIKINTINNFAALKSFVKHITVAGSVNLHSGRNVPIIYLHETGWFLML